MSKLVRKVVPVRSKNAVNKSVIEKRVTSSRKSTKQINKVEDDRLDEIFQKNLEMAIALLPTVSFKYIQPVRKWMSKFFDPSVQKSKRNFYLAYLIFQMQNMKVLDPFNKNPPQSLVDSSKMSGAAKWKTLIQDADKDYLERAKERICVQEWGNFRKEFKGPCDFLDDQPIPLNGGIVCYGGCFSNYFQ